jgi:transcriptional regulator with XRE-family HTH domain
MRSPISRRAGQAVRKLRLAKGWTLMTLSRRTGVPLSTLSKLELGQSVLTHEKWALICGALEVEPADEILQSLSEGATETRGRRSVWPRDGGLHSWAGPYRVQVAAADLIAKAFTPMIVALDAHSLEEHGPLRRTPGEMFVYAVEGVVLVCSDGIEPLALAEGDGVYFDGAHPHALLAGSDPTRALLVLPGEGPFWT